MESRLSSSFESFCLWKEAMDWNIQSYCQEMKSEGFSFLTQMDLWPSRSSIQRDCCLLVKWMDEDGCAFYDKQFQYPLHKNSDQQQQQFIMEPNYDTNENKSCGAGIHLITVDACLRYAIMSGILPFQKVRLLFCSVPLTYLNEEGQQVDNSVQRGPVFNLWKVRVECVVPHGSVELKSSRFHLPSEPPLLISKNDQIQVVESFLSENVLLPHCHSCDVKLDFTIIQNLKCQCGALIPESVIYDQKRDNKSERYNN